MSEILANYSFLPWLRMGIVNKIKSGDLDTSVKLRANVQVDLQLEGQKLESGKITSQISKNVDLFGPGDIIGIDPKAIVKVEPQNWITNFEPNYLPYIEFYEEDFPWRYTPAAPDNAKDRLRPWIALVILKEGDFKEATNMKDKPLSYFICDKASEKFPRAEELWAWAHVHINEAITNNIVALPSEKETIVNKIKNLIAQKPDIASSRILCPMKLESNTAYHAFLIPTFETGRLAGLGLKTEESAGMFATLSAWADLDGKMEATSFPYYHRWHFRTGSIGDFEYLVRLLQPKPVDSRVGNRPFDVQNPGSNIEGISDLEGILKLGGALKIPFDSMNKKEQQEYLKYDNWDKSNYPHPFQTELSDFINLSDNYLAKSSLQANNDSNIPSIEDDEDPLITPPLYGRWHSLTQRLLKDEDGNDLPQNKNWVHQLNLDPRWRSTAGFGVRVVQENQEDYMRAAWQQVGDILEANKKLRLGILAKSISTSYYQKQIQPLFTISPEKALLFSAPLQKRVLNNGITIFHQVKQSVVTSSATSSTLRRILRPNGRVIKNLPFSGEVNAGNLLERINNREVHIASPKDVSPFLPTLDHIADEIIKKNIPGPALLFLKIFPWMKWIMVAIIFILLIFLLFVSLPEIAVAVISASILALTELLFLTSKWQNKLSLSEAVKEETQKPSAVEKIPFSPDFKLSAPEENFRPSNGKLDSIEGARYKTALKEALNLLDLSTESGKQEMKPSLDFSNLVKITFASIDPAITIPKYIFGNVFIPDRIKKRMVETFVEAMAYPEMDIPMYKPLVNVSSELFLPNINYIEQNSISLLETNQPFIESYMVGLNHEFAKELLWREYPTDQRGSYFRQFWDVSSHYDTSDNTDAENVKEKLKDIPPIHLWSKYSVLGDHDHREQGGEKEEEVVLVIRGELLKKYPTAVIYAQRATWQLNKDGTINNKVERELLDFTPAEQLNPPKDKLKTPLYEAKVDPDIYFFGFDLKVSEAQGGTGDTNEDLNNAGWFFCIKERPGEARFGLDIDKDTTPNVWNDLSWQDLLPGKPAGSFIEINNTTPSIPLSPLAISDNEKEEQRADDNHVSWNKNMNAAEVAYILYQVPVLVAVHASEMLPKNS